MKTSTNRLQFTAFTLALALLGGVGWQSWRHTAEMQETARWVAHTHKMQAERNRLLARVLELESAQRNYVLTGGPEFLDQFERFAQQAAQQERGLEELTHDEQQRASLAALKPVIAARIAFARHTLALRQNSGLEEAAREIATRKGIQLTDQIRALAAEMDARGEVLLQQRSTQAAREARHARTLTLAGCALSSLLFLGAFALMRRENRLRRQAGRALGQSEENLAVTLQSIGDAVLATDARGRVTRLNPVAETLTGWPQAEAVGRPVAEVFHIINETTRQPAFVPVADTLAKGTIHGLANHTILIARTGTERPIADSCAPIRSREGAVIGAVLVFRDVTEERDHEAALRQVQESLKQRVRERTAELELGRAQLAAAFGNMPMGVVLSNAQGGDIVMNAAAARMHGFASPAEVPARLDDYAEEWELRDATGRVLPLAGWPLSRAIAGDFCRDWEIHLRNPRRGHQWDCSYTAVPVRDPAGGVSRIILTLVDITERRRAEGEIRALNTHLEERVAERTAELATAGAELHRSATAIDAMQDAVFMFAADTLRFFSVNEGAVRQVGYSRAELLAMTPLDIKPGFTEARFRALIAPLLDGRKTAELFTTLHRHKDGTDVPVEINLQVAGEGGQRCFVALCRDVSQRQKAEAALRASEERFRALATTGSQIIWLADAAGEVHGPLPGWQQSTGMTEAAVQGHGWSSAIHADDLPAVMAQWQQAVGARRPVELHYRLRRHDGTYRQCVDHAVPVFAEDGSLREWIGSVMDVTEKKQAEAALRDSEERLRLALDAAQLGTFDWDVAADCIVWSTWHEVLFGYRPGEFPGTYAGFDGRVHPEDRAAVKAAVARCTAQRAAFHHEFRVVWPDGSEHWIQAGGEFTFDAEGRAVRMRGVVLDIDERKRAEEAVRMALDELSRANAELDAASRHKDEFLANMSHELRTPLNAILGLSEALLEQIHAPLTPRQVKSISTISTSGQHLLALINDILDLSKIEAGKLELHPERLSVDEFCQGCLAFVKTQAVRKQIYVDHQRHTQPLILCADPKRFKQILVNLLANAVKFTPEGGRIGLIVAAPEGEGVVRLTVWDHGIGIAPADQAKLFRAFTQVDSGLNRSQEGTGLGLALVAKLVELHGGSVALESEPGRGSRFIVTLPLTADGPDWQPAGPRPAPPPAAPGGAARLEQSAALGPAAHFPPPLPHEPPAHLPDRPVTPVASGAGLVILLAEDNEANIQTIGGYLEDKGYAMNYAVNGRLAVQLARELRPALILMDIQMPMMDGLTAIRELRADPAFPAVPIIALTALAMSGDRERCLAAGATAYLSKPVKLRELAGLMERFLEKHDA